MAQLDYDGNDYEEEYGQIPPGKYQAVVVKTEILPMKNDKGRGCRVTFSILEGDYKGRQLSCLYAIYHVERDKQDMARQIFARFCKQTIGKMNPKDTDELLRHKTIIEVVIDGEYSNIKRTFPAESAKEQTSPQRKPVSRPADPVSAPLPRIEPEPSYSRPAPTAADCPF